MYYNFETKNSENCFQNFPNPVWDAQKYLDEIYKDIIQCYEEEKDNKCGVISNKKLRYLEYHINYTLYPWIVSLTNFVENIFMKLKDNCDNMQ